MLRLTAAALLLLSLLLPWYCVPVSVRGDLYNGYAAILREPASTLVFKAFLLLVFLGAWWIGHRRRRSAIFSWATPMTVCGGLLFVVITILYPALTVQRCAAVSAQAAWLQMQNASMIRVDGDLRTAQEFAYRSGQPDVYVKDLVPRTFVVVSTPVDSLFKLRLAKLSQLLMWLGFSPPFSEFARLGWFCGVFGSFLLAASFSRTENVAGLSRHPFSGPYRTLAYFMPGALLACSICFVPIVMAGRELAVAREAAVEGRFGESLRHLDLAEVWMPVLAYHTDIVYQRGWLDRKLGSNTWEAQLNSAIREETEGFYARAVEHYAPLLEPDVPGPVRAEAFRGTLRLAINDFNTGLIDRASDRLEQLLAIDPTCLKANYALQLADLRSFRKDRLEAAVAQFTAVYRCLQSIEKRVAIAAAHRRIAELEFDFHNMAKLSDEMRAAVQQ